MKFIVRLTLMLVFGLSANSQITLTSNISPAPGDNQYQVRIDTIGIDSGGSGPNQAWNFQNLTKLDSSVVQWLSASSTPHGNLFPTANVAGLDTCYNYFSLDTALVQFVGYYSQGTAISLSNPETIMRYPFGYNSTFTDNFSAVISQNGDVIYRNGTVTAIGDAWGIINLPFGVYINVLRVKQYINIIDSSTLYHTTVVTKYKSYAWYAPGRKFSIFNIVYTNIDISGLFTFTHKNAYYNPSSTLIGITQISTQVPTKPSLGQNYPNPFNPATKIDFDVPKSGQVKLVVFDLLGREVGKPVDEFLKPGVYSVDFNASSLSSGTYFYTLSTQDFAETKRMVLVK